MCSSYLQGRLPKATAQLGAVAGLGGSTCDRYVTLYA